MNQAFEQKQLLVPEIWSTSRTSKPCNLPWALREQEGENIGMGIFPIIECIMAEDKVSVPTQEALEKEMSALLGKNNWTNSSHEALLTKERKENQVESGTRGSTGLNSRRRSSASNSPLSLGLRTRTRRLLRPSALRMQPSMKRTSC